jgi:hypothetical protein
MIKNYEILQDSYGIKISPAKTINNIIKLLELKKVFYNLKAGQDNADDLLKLGNYKIYFEGWCNKCIPKDIDRFDIIQYIERETPKIIEDKRPKNFEVIEGGYISNNFKNNPYGITYAIYKKGV